MAAGMAGGGQDAPAERGRLPIRQGKIERRQPGGVGGVADNARAGGGGHLLRSADVIAMVVGQQDPVAAAARPLLQGGEHGGRFARVAHRCFAAG